MGFLSSASHISQHPDGGISKQYSIFHNRLLSSWPARPGVWSVCEVTEAHGWFCGVRLSMKRGGTTKERKGLSKETTAALVEGGGAVRGLGEGDFSGLSTFCFPKHSIPLTANQSHELGRPQTVPCSDCPEVLLWVPVQ